VSLDELYPVDVYPVGALADLLALRAALREAIRPRWLTRADARGYLLDVARKAARNLWRNRHASAQWHGFHAEPKDTRYVRRAGRGWTRDRARHDLARHMIAVMGARYGGLRPGNVENTAALAASLATAWRQETGE
jgi:hypothetical protein